MSSTRYAEEGSPLRQERYASDPAFNEALKASAVAKRCGLFTDPRHKELCLHLQYISMQPGGLSAFVTDFLDRYSDRIGSKTMRENRTRRTFDADLILKIRSELRDPELFPLKGEIDTIDPLCSEFEKARQRDREEYTDTAYQDAERSRQKTIAEGFPKSYPASELVEYCLPLAYGDLEEWLIDFCLNPKADLTNPPNWFYDLEQSLFDYLSDRRIDALAGKVVTSIGEQINDALDYAWEEKCMVHINGVARMGKTFQVEQWCRCHPGRVRYVQVPSSNDDISFFRSIARAIGTNSGSSMNITQIKRQVEDTIQDAGIMLVLDEAHFLFPQHKRSFSYPRRINWVLTEIVNKGLPVAIVTTPQFDVYQETVINNTGWAAEQLDGRIAYRIDLPADLPTADLEEITKYNFPAAGKEIIKPLSQYAYKSGKYLAGIEAVAKRARFLAKKDGRVDPDGADIRAAMLAVDPGIAKLSEEQKTTECNPPAKAVKRSRRGVAQAVQAAEKELVGAD